MGAAGAKALTGPERCQRVRALDSGPLRC